MVADAVVLVFVAWSAWTARLKPWESRLDSPELLLGQWGIRLLAGYGMMSAIVRIVSEAR